jgi:D-alanyl-lipoteichoic acid acyltransferase DltB (MBOAT superfamily)
MLFNSISFAIFLPIVFVLYWFGAKENLKFQNILLLISSYFFYACWDWRFLFLLIFSTLLDYISGIKIHKVKTKKLKLIWLFISICVNLGFLGVFKYYNFFAGSFESALSLSGFHSNFGTLQVILPVGISIFSITKLNLKEILLITRYSSVFFLYLLPDRLNAQLIFCLKLSKKENLIIQNQ